MNIKNSLGYIISFLVTILTCLLIFYFRDYLYRFYRDYIVHERDNITIKYNEYSRKKNFLYVQNTDDFIANNEQDVLNIIYTVIDSGEDEFTFYCDDNYTNCTSYIASITNSDTILSMINNFVSPFNSFKTINFSYDSKGKVTVSIKKNYSDEEISAIDKKIDEILINLNLDNIDNEEQITKIHNYIIDNANYATDDIKDDNDIYNKANGVLLNGYGTCNSYTDAMALFLDRLKIDNYKISSNTHVWNLVSINNTYYHIDLTFDDPILSDGSHIIDTDYLLINDERLVELDKNEHNYDKNIYLELKTQG